MVLRAVKHRCAVARRKRESFIAVTSKAGEFLARLLEKFNPTMHFIFKTLVRLSHALSYSPTQKLYVLKNPIFRSICTFSIDKNQHSFTVSYLINSCGLSPESALKASKQINFETPQKPDKVLTFFNNHGFSETQVSRIISLSPKLILVNPEMTLLPKLEFFYGKGFSVPDLAKTLSSNPPILERSLKNLLIPRFEFYGNLLQSNEKTISAIKRYSMILLLDFHTNTKPNIDTLLENGVPEAKIKFLLTNQPRMFSIPLAKFKEYVEEVKKMRLDPLNWSFLLAILALTVMSKSTWKRKVEVYKRWGWSEEVILQNFRKYPWCMMYSEKKIMATMDFLVNKMGWESSAIARRAHVISLSLHKRIVPRCLVVQALISKGLIKKDVSLGVLFQPQESFLRKFVTCYEAEAPHLLKLYHKEKGLSK